jgi:hypothetical protein
MWKKSSQKSTEHREDQRTDREPVVVHESTREWETWPGDEIAQKPGSRVGMPEQPGLKEEPPRVCPRCGKPRFLAQ